MYYVWLAKQAAVVYRWGISLSNTSLLVMFKRVEKSEWGTQMILRPGVLLVLWGAGSNPAEASKYSSVVETNSFELK